MAGARQLLKLFEYVLLNIWEGHLESDSLQFGFKPGTSADHCTWLLNAVTKHYLHWVSPPSGVLGLVQQVSKNVTCGGVLSPVFMYQEKSGFVLIQGRRSATFRLSDEVRGGAAASPILWAVYVNGLLLLL